MLCVVSIETTGLCIVNRNLLILNEEHKFINFVSADNLAGGSFQLPERQFWKQFSMHAINIYVKKKEYHCLHLVTSKIV